MIPWNLRGWLTTATGRVYLDMRSRAVNGAGGVVITAAGRPVAVIGLTIRAGIIVAIAA